MDKKLWKDILGIALLTVLAFILLLNFNILINLIKLLFSLFFPFLLGLAIAFILNVILKKVEKKLPIKRFQLKRATSIIITLILVFGMISFLMFLIIPELQNTVKLLISNLPTYQEQIINWMEQFAFSKDLVNQIQARWGEISQTITTFIKDNSNQLLTVTIGVTSSVISGIFNFILGIVFAVYILAEKEKYGKQTERALYAFIPKKRADQVIKIGKLSHRIFSNFVSGQLTEAIIIGILCFLGMLLLRLPYAPTISVLVGFTALIPVFGAFFGTAIGAILIFAISPIQAFIFIIFIIVLQQIEGNFIYSKVIGNSVGLPSLWVMLAVMIGGSALGIVGMLLSVPICSVLYAILKEIIQTRLQEKRIVIT